MSVTDRYRRQIRENLPVVYEGLTFHPLTVRDYDLFLRGKESFELMQSSLQSPKMARLPWCACLWALDEEYYRESGKPGFFFISVLSVMAAALRLDVYADEENVGQKSLPIRPAFTQSGELSSICIGFPHDPAFTILSMQKMDEVRKIIAAQNGYEIPDENWNPELVKAAQYNASTGNSGIVADRETLIFSVAAQYRIMPKEVYDWSIRDFVGICNALDRDKHFMLCGYAEMNGVTFKHGNPFPTWKYDRKSELPTGFKSIAEMDANSKGLIAGA